jgi:acyl-coenzyme A synthetase/AMP-(fatty) acid ligase
VLLHRGRALAAKDFSAAVASLLREWPNARHIVNLCENRFYFLAAFSAAALSEQTTLLPPNNAGGTLDTLAIAYQGSTRIDDAFVASILDRADSASAGAIPNWQIDIDRIVALTFTSGSTGAPTPHGKSWRLLSTNAKLAVEEVLGGAGANIVATVPAQHVYGLETSALSALVAECSVFDGKPFFPNDVRSALAAMNAPCTLVTTPTHLKVLLESGIDLPSLRRIVSATATLSKELAERIEQRWRAPVHEIYGCTEAGIMANRRTVESEQWRTFTGGVIDHIDGVAHYSAPQLSSRLPLQDIIESFTPTRFELRGRMADLVKVAGKRTSLQALTKELLGIEGVKDAIVFVPHADARPAAFAVAPGLSAKEISNRLFDRIDPVFMPRPLHVVDALPRNAVGKLPQETLLSMLRARKTADTPTILETSFTVPPTHPSLAGHFPGNPIVPGVVLLDMIVAAAQSSLPSNVALCELRAAKFILPIKPNDVVELSLRIEKATDRAESGAWRVHFNGMCNDLPAIDGSIVFQVIGSEMVKL